MSIYYKKYLKYKEKYAKLKNQHGGSDWCNRYYANDNPGFIDNIIAWFRCNDNDRNNFDKIKIMYYLDERLTPEIEEENRKFVANASEEYKQLIENKNPIIKKESNKSDREPFELTITFYTSMYSRHKDNIKTITISIFNGPKLGIQYIFSDDTNPIIKGSNRITLSRNTIVDLKNGIKKYYESLRNTIINNDQYSKFLEKLNKVLEQNVTDTDFPKVPSNKIYVSKSDLLP